ncbi:hypothetical protein [Corallococcus sp. 4LFB]|uniref:hypothetical protein n=1 Tax=Corallococcus sp. 4LFB TaxID=3383249 RepID=UPI0039761E0F
MGWLLTGMPVNAAEPVPAADSDEMKLLCTGVEVVPRLGLPSDPRFVINRMGAVKLVRDAKPLMAVDLGGNDRSAWVQVERVTPKGVRHPVACGPVNHGLRYLLPDADAATEKDRLVVRLFDLARGREEQARLQSIREEREKVLLTPEFVEREQAALRNLANVDAITDAVKRFVVSPTPKADVEASVVGALTEAASVVEQLRAACPDGKSTSSGPALLKKICEEERTLEVKLKAVSEAFKRYDQALKDDAFKDWRKEFRDALQVAARDLKPGAQVEGKAYEEHCKQVAMLNWLHSDKVSHLVAQVELPMVEGSRIVEASYGEGDSKQDLPSGSNEPLAVLLHDVVSGAELAVGTSQSLAEPKGPAEALAGAITFLANAKMLGGIARAPAASLGAPAKSSPQRLLGFSAEWPSLVCPGKPQGPPANAGPSEGNVEVTLKVDVGAPSLARTGTRTLIVEPLDKGSRREIYVCDGQPCEPSKENAKVRNRVVLNADREDTLSLLVELAGTAALEGQGGFTTPRYVALGSSAGPQRVYELRGDYRAQDVASISVMLGVRLSQDLLVALGPSLLVGTSGGTFSQVGVRLGIKLTHGVFFTTGPSLRFVQTATKEAPLGSRIAVANAEEPKVPAPPGLEYQPRLGWSVGLAVDTSALTDAGKSLLKTVGVTQ